MKVFECDQLATFMMSIIKTFLFLAEVVATDLVECPLTLLLQARQDQRERQLGQKS